MNKKKQLIDLIHRLVYDDDQEAFKEIYLQNYNRLLRYGLILTQNQEQVADAIQDLFIWVWKNRNQLEKVNNFEVYLFISLKRNLLSYFNKKLRLVKGIEHLESKSHQSNIEDHIIKEETDLQIKKWLTQQLDNLPIKQKEVIYLRYYEGLSYDEIGEILSKSNQVVRNYASKALNQIRRIAITPQSSD